MIKCEIRELYDIYGTGKYTEDKRQRTVFESKEFVIERSFACHESMGNKRKETSKYIAYQRQINARRIIEYIYYK